MSENKLISVQVFDSETSESLSDVCVSVAGYPDLDTYTNEKGMARLVYPQNDGNVTIYADGNEVYDDYVSSLPKILTVEI